MKRLLLFIFCVSCSSLPPQKHKITKPEWMAKSDVLAEEFSRERAELQPEIGSDIGFAEYNVRGSLIDNQIEDKNRALYVRWLSRIQNARTDAKDLELMTDLDVLANWLQNQVMSIDLSREARQLIFNQAVNSVYGGLRPLVGEQVDNKTRAASVDRFRVYVRGDDKHLPLLPAMQELWRDSVRKYKDQKMYAPYVGEVEQYLKDHRALVAGVEELLQKSGRNDWADDYAVFKKQADAYEKFVREEVLPLASKDARMPSNIYAYVLKARGIDATPNELIKSGLEGYKNLYPHYRELAKTLAKKYGLKKSDPVSVITYFKASPITQLKDVEALYRDADSRLQKIMTDQNLITVPTTPARIRFASEAESLVMPVPHLNQPPLLGNKGERPEFVVPTSSKGLPFDDFSSKYSAIGLTAHEGRPGHDMQFSQMLDRGVSVIRGRYAANNVNIEGWALYAEDLVYPYVLPEEQLFLLQMRLWRIARMFLDPQLQLGLIKDQRVIEVFTKELGVSKVMAGLELRRYKFEDIGQAPSYYYGYLLVKEMRLSAEKRLGSAFNVKCFNDRLLSYGLLPLKVSAERMKSGDLCALP
tara:strand:- start:998 stop:2755 length:1758 start_codon:yes stop_codon:yes gene_type:complete